MALTIRGAHAVLVGGFTPRGWYWFPATDEPDDTDVHEVTDTNHVRQQIATSVWAAVDNVATTNANVDFPAYAAAQAGISWVGAADALTGGNLMAKYQIVDAGGTPAPINVVAGQQVRIASGFAATLALT